MITGVCIRNKQLEQNKEGVKRSMGWQVVCKQKSKKTDERMGDEEA